MNATHTRLANVATRLIDSHGRAAQLISFVETGPNYAPIRSQVPETVTLVQSSFNASEVDGTLIQSQDKLFILDSSVKPTNDMILRDGTTDYEIKNVVSVNPGDVVCLYKVQARI